MCFGWRREQGILELRRRLAFWLVRAFTLRLADASSALLQDEEKLWVTDETEARSHITLELETSNNTLVRLRSTLPP